jgi:hypothetical protein
MKRTYCGDGENSIPMLLNAPRFLPAHSYDTFQRCRNGSEFASQIWNFTLSTSSNSAVRPRDDAEATFNDSGTELLPLNFNRPISEMDQMVANPTPLKYLLLICWE